MVKFIHKVELIDDNLNDLIKNLLAVNTVWNKIEYDLKEMKDNQLFLLPLLSNLPIIIRLFPDPFYLKIYSLLLREYILCIVHVEVKFSFLTLYYALFEVQVDSFERNFFTIFENFIVS